MVDHYFIYRANSFTCHIHSLFSHYDSSLVSTWVHSCIYALIVGVSLSMTIYNAMIGIEYEIETFTSLGNLRN